MIALDRTTRSITVQLAGAVSTTECPWVVSWDVGTVATDFGATSGTTPVPVVAAPTNPPANSRKLLSFSVFNSDTAAVQVTVAYVDGVATHILQRVILQVGESLAYEDKSGWFGLDVNGNQKVASNTVQVSTALSVAVVASSAASNAAVSNSQQSLSISAVSSLASLGALGSSQASSAHSAIGNESAASSIISRVKSSFLF